MSTKRYTVYYTRKGTYNQKVRTQKTVRADSISEAESIIKERDSEVVSVEKVEVRN